MKRKTSFLLSLIALCGALCAAPFAKHQRTVIEASADSTTNYPRNGQSGNILYVNGGSKYFNTGEADLAIYCYNSESDNAWSDRVSYRCFNDILRVMIPYQNGNYKTWSNYIVCRYNPNKNPASDGWSCVYNQTNNISFSSMMYAQNVVNITGYNGDKMNYAFSTADYYGIRADNHMYLDLSGFTGWEDGGAKFAIYFACPSSTDEKRWSQSNSNGGYYSSFCWKVNGQDNNHLYECIVPSVNSLTLWNLVIAVRFDPVASEPGWNNVWNQTQNLSFNSSNHTNNMIHVDDWNHAELDSENVISRDTRLEFYGRYFLNNVACSGTGNSDATTNAMWTLVENEYVNHLSTTYQGEVWKCAGDESGSLLAQSMARYDYIVLYKQYSHNDFINRQDSPNKTEYSINAIALYDNTNKSIWIIVLIICVTMLSSILVLRRFKTKKY